MCVAAGKSLGVTVLQRERLDTTTLSNCTAALHMSSSAAGVGGKFCVHGPASTCGEREGVDTLHRR